MDSPNDYDIGNMTGGGIAIGYGFTDNIAAELSYLAWDGDADTTWVTGLWSLPKAGKAL